MGWGRTHWRCGPLASRLEDSSRLAFKGICPPRRLKTCGYQNQKRNCKSNRLVKFHFLLREVFMCIQEYNFALILTGVHELTTEMEDALFEAGCDDSTLILQQGSISMEFSRTAASLNDAILSAIRDVGKANVG